MVLTTWLLDKGKYVLGAAFCSLANVFFSALAAVISSRYYWSDDYCWEDNRPLINEILKKLKVKKGEKMKYFQSYNITHVYIVETSCVIKDISK